MMAECVSFSPRFFVVVALRKLLANDVWPNFFCIYIYECGGWRRRWDAVMDGSSNTSIERRVCIVYILYIRNSFFFISMVLFQTSIYMSFHRNGCCSFFLNRNF